MTSVGRANERDGGFAEETGELTVWRWKTGAALYLLFTMIAVVFEWRYHPDRAWLLVLSVAAQVAIVLVTRSLLVRAPIHPLSAWIALLCGVGVCMVLAVYNGAVDGDMLYLLLTYLAFMLVSSVFIPWGARFQIALNVGVVAAYAVGVAGGAKVGPMPAYDYTAIVAVMIFSTLGAYYVDEYRRVLFDQAHALRVANRSLQAANQARTELLSGLSHDMRTPLSVLIGYGDILAETPALSDDVALALRSIRRESHELLALVDAVLDLAQLEAGHLPFRRSAFALAGVLDPLRETTEDQLQGREVRLRWEIPPALMVDSDAGKVREIVRNLLSNAVKYTQVGEIALSAAPARNGVEITVADTGFGIDKAHQERIFGAFQRVAADADGQASSLGFGLYMVRLLTRLVGGHIDVQSLPGSGSTFRLWLPPEPPLTTNAARGVAAESRA